MKMIQKLYFKNSNMCQDTALTKAAAKSNKEIVQLLLKHPNIDVNSIHIFNLLYK